MAPTDLRPVNLDVPRAARRGLTVAKRIEPLLPALSAIPDLDVPRIRKLPTYALALLFAHEQAIAPTPSEVHLSMLLDEAVPLRLDLLVTAEMLAHFGLVSPERVAAIRSGQGHADTAADLLALGVLLDEVWDEVEDGVVVTRAQVDRATPLSAQLQQAIGVRESDADPLAKPTNDRHVRAQAYTLFVAAYDECRRGVTHLRWHHGDAARIVPSLYVGRRSRAPSEDGGDEQADEAMDPSRGFEDGGHGEPTLVAEPTADAIAFG
ncbi:hypothetical protein [Paraliomyxa miuraensis]|uniref:hypothetical protein n=1 Tax=Paraliomyxa miuraensis TaxID=376150 RepID=UPI002258AA78|nr:hypothetical protein [Paraliomyxa miuraensis]